MQPLSYEFPQIQAPLLPLEPPHQDLPPVAPPPAQPTPPPKDKRPGKFPKIAGGILLVIILIAGAFIGGYATAPKSTATETQTETAKPETTATAAAATDPHFILSRGTPVQPKNPVSYTTKIGVPASLQAVRLDPPTQGQNLGFTLFGGDVGNNNLAAIGFGNPENPTENGGGLSELSLTAITKDWLAADAGTDYSLVTAGFPAGIPMNPLQTPADKKAFMDGLPNAVSVCAKDNSKGFKTDDGTLSVCYVTAYGKDGYSPVVTLLGYGNVNNQPAVLYGSISLYDDTVGSSADAQHAAVEAANQGKPTTRTAAAQAELLKALKQSSVLITKS